MMLTGMPDGNSRVARVKILSLSLAPMRVLSDVAASIVGMPSTSRMMLSGRGDNVLATANAECMLVPFLGTVRRRTRTASLSCCPSPAVSQTPSVPRITGSVTLLNM